MVEDWKLLLLLNPDPMFILPAMPVAVRESPEMEVELTELAPRDDGGFEGV